MDRHLEAMKRLCRICGGNTSKYRVSYKVLEHASSLNTAFSVDVDSDLQDVHTLSFRDTCYAVVKRKENADCDNKAYKHSIEVYQWYPHKESRNTCDSYFTLQNGGRTN
jgi:hypothetical protein